MRRTVALLAIAWILACCGGALVPCLAGPDCCGDEAGPDGERVACCADDEGGGARGPLDPACPQDSACCPHMRPALADSVVSWIVPDLREMSLRRAHDQMLDSPDPREILHVPRPGGPSDFAAC